MSGLAQAPAPALFDGPPPERDGIGLLLGAGNYLADYAVPGLVVAAILRAPVAHGRIRSLDISAAEALPGVLAILTGSACHADGLGPIEPMARAIGTDGQPCIVPPFPLLAHDKVVWCGQPVALVLAETEAAARDALEAVAVSYDELPAVLGPMKPGDPIIHVEAPDNVSYRWAAGDQTATDAAFATAAQVVTCDLINNRVHACPMEARGAMALPGNPAVLVSGTQMPRGLAAGVAACLNLPKAELPRVVVPDMGGGFGMKGPVYPEQALVLWAARRLNRPVRWLSERGEAFLGDAHSRNTANHIALALDLDGRILGLKLAVTANLGAFVIGHGSTVPQGGMGLVTGLYNIAAYRAEVTGIFTNTAPVDAYRGAGRPEVMYALERAMDVAAQEIGLDPVEFRRRNLIAPDAMPARLPSGMVLDSGDPISCLDRALEIADRAGFEVRRAASARHGLLRGQGLALFVDRTGAGGAEWAGLTLQAEGTILAAFGTQSSGQGHAQAYRNLLTERLGVDPDRVRIVQGDTDFVRGGHGSYGSRSLILGGESAIRAAETFLDLARQRAAQRLEVDAFDVVRHPDGWCVEGTDRRLDWRELFDPASPLEAEGRFEPTTHAFPYGCHICEVEVDPETGQVQVLRYIAVDDYGAVLEPALLEGQLHGGVAQGLGQALQEDIRYDKHGQLLAGSLNDYALPRAADFPQPHLETRAIICRTNSLGAKGCGEAGAIAAPPAVMNAILDALAPMGVRVLDMPATPHAIWQALRKAKTR